MKTSAALLVVFVVFILYLFFIIPIAQAPLTYDELYWPTGAHALIKDGRAVHFLGGSADWSPPLYLTIQVFLYRLFLESAFTSRLIGIFCVLLQLVIFWLITCVLFEDAVKKKRFFLWTVVLFMTNPAVIQGSMLPFDETTLLGVFSSLFFLFFLRYEKNRNPNNLLILALVFSISLWSKLTIPFLAIASLAAYYYFNKDLKGIKACGVVFISGLLLFLSGWFTYSKVMGLEFIAPFRYVLTALFTKTSTPIAGSKIIGDIATIVRIVLWVGFYQVLLLVIILYKRFTNLKDKLRGEPVDFLLFYSIIVGIGFIIIGGAQFGFPKYHYPMFWAFCVLGAFFLSDIAYNVSKKQCLFFTFAAITLFYYFLFAARDLIYIFNFSIKNAAVSYPYSIAAAAAGFFGKFALYVLPLPVLLFINKYFLSKARATLRIFIIIAALILSGNLSLDFIQRKADYRVGFCYGEEGTGELLGLLGRETVPGETILAANDIIYYAENNIKEYLPLDFWYRLDDVLSQVKLKHPKFVIYSVGHNDIRQFKEVFLSHEFVSQMQSGYSFRKVGTYQVWERMK